MRRYKHFGTVWTSSNPTVANLSQFILQILNPAFPLLYHLFPYLLSRLCRRLQLSRLLLRLLQRLSPPLPSSLIMSPISSPYLAAILTSSPMFSPPLPAETFSPLPLLSLPSPPTSPPTTYSVIPPVITPAGELLDNEKPVFIVFWNQASPNL